jgi:hypothetical protein
MSKKLSRRAFLRGMGATGAGLAAMMAGCAPQTVVVEKEVTVEVETEKVVKEKTRRSALATGAGPNRMPRS